jgi:TfoX/Sxy family transcriptional regulator of competence genes
MAYDAVLAARVAKALAGVPGVLEKRMFGGVGYLVRGNMACGVHGSDLIVRVGPERSADALAQPGARPFDLSGKAMAGWVYVAPGAIEADRELVRWVVQGVDFAETLPAK